MGGVESVIVTVAVQVAVLPWLSVTVSVMELPLSAQTKVLSLSTSELMPQASVELLSTATAVVLPLPPASRDTVTSWHKAAGAMVSSTVMSAVQVAVLPLSSDTVRVT